MKIDLNITRISDSLLLQQTDFLVRQERATTVSILRHLREIEIRRLYIDLGFSSMHKYCIQSLKYSEGQAHRRLTSARLLTELPEIEQQIQEGAVNLTNLSKVQSFVRAEKAANCPLDKQEKLNLISSLENKSTREVEKELVKKSHQPLLLAEKFRMSAEELTVVRTEANIENMLDVPYRGFETLRGIEQQELLQDFKNLYAHELADMSNHSILTFLLGKAVAHKRKKLGLSSKNGHNAPPPSAPKVAENIDSGKEGNIKSQRKVLSVFLKRKLWQRANGCCEYVDPKSQVRCSSKFALAEDHIEPVALGGTNELSNLQLLCRAHNSRRAVKTFGAYRVSSNINTAAKF